MRINIEQEITNVPEMLMFLEKFRKSSKKQSLFFRGESKIYGSTTENTNLLATLFRQVRVIKENDHDSFEYHTLDSYRKAAQAFHREIKVSNTMEQNFMAFCQHYGIPTPLLDVSASPLVALFFACQGNDKDSGLLHVIDKDSLVKMPSSYLHYYESESIESERIYPLSNYKMLVQCISDYAQSQMNSGKTNWDDLMRSIITQQQAYAKSNLDGLDEGRMKFFAEINSFEELRVKLNTVVFDNKHNEIQTLYIQFLKTIGYIKTNLKELDGIFGGRQRSLNNIYLYVFLIFIAQYYTSGATGEFYPNDLFFYVESSSDWDRIKLQKGSFIIEVPKFGLTSPSIKLDQHQTLKPNNIILPYKQSQVIRNLPRVVTLKVENKKSILRELDVLGINKQSLFGDLDHIAEYTKEQYY